MTPEEPVTLAVTHYDEPLYRARYISLPESKVGENLGPKVSKSFTCQSHDGFETVAM